jgi:type I restriction enzyme, S subunit
MAGEWKDGSLGDVIELKRGYDLPQRDRRFGTFPIVSSSGVIGFHSEHKAVGPGVVIGRYGTLGQVHYIKQNYWPHNTALYVCDFKGNDPLFVRYFLQSLDFQAYSDKAAVPGLNRNHLHQHIVHYPVDVHEQRAIAHILGTLDDKIDINHRMNESLEGVARATFKSWFVDFDPVRAKSERRSTGLPKEIADLFPDRFVDSELGEIPAGWVTKSLGEIIELAYGKALKEEDRLPGRVPVFGSNGQIGWHSRCLATGPGIVVGRKGNPGTITWAATDFFPIDTTFYIIPKSGIKSYHFLFYALGSHDLKSLGADSAVPGLNRNLAYLDKQVVPSENAVKVFDEQAKCLYQRIHASNQESATLAELRDVLLPKLISGKLRLKDTERFAQKAGM